MSGNLNKKTIQTVGHLHFSVGSSIEMCELPSHGSIGRAIELATLFQFFKVVHFVVATKAEMLRRSRFNKKIDMRHRPSSMNDTLS